MTVKDFDESIILESYKRNESISKVLKELGINHTGTQVKNVSFILKKNDVKIRQYNKSFLEENKDLVAKNLPFSKTIKDLALKIGFLKDKKRSISSRQYDNFILFFKKNNLDYSHLLEVKQQERFKQKKQKEEEIFCKESQISPSALKKRFLKKVEYKCSLCGNKGEWNKKHLSLQIDHINGNRKDNRMENLRLLCPNCHSQTDNFSGANRNIPL